jgi:hypothetical protein
MNVNLLQNSIGAVCAFARGLRTYNVDVVVLLQSHWNWADSRPFHVTWTLYTVSVPNR